MILASNKLSAAVLPPTKKILEKRFFDKPVALSILRNGRTLKSNFVLIILASTGPLRRLYQLIQSLVI